MHRGFEPIWSGWLGWLLPLLFFGVLIALAVGLYYALRRRPAPVTDGDPLRRAAGRYANGEIERVEFERIQRDLTHSNDDSVQTAAMRLARGDISISEFDELRGRLTADETTVAGESGTAGESPTQDAS